MDPFVTADDLADYPGAPFSDQTVKGVVERIRQECGWHVAPVVTETIRIDGDGGLEQWLPTRRVVNVTGVRVWNGSAFVPMAGWSPEVGWSESGILSASRPFPIGRRVIEVDLEHGFEVTAALAAVVASAAQRRITAETIGGRSLTYSDDDAFGPASTGLDAYRLGPRP